MPVKHSKEANLWPLNVQFSLALGLKNIKNDTDAIFVVLTNNALVSVGSITFNDSTFLSAGFCRLMVLQKQLFRVKNWWVFTE